MELSVILPTYNPKLQSLQQTLEGLKNQSLDQSAWNLILIDNNSSNQFQTQIDLKWHVHATLISQPKQGLSYARLKGFEQATGDVIVMVDDDNILDVNYLQTVFNLFENHLKLGAAGGKSLPLFEATPPAWLDEFKGSLALRDLGDNPIIAEWNNNYPESAPIGAGMAIRKEALLSYLQKAASSQNLIADRTAATLSSGGDNDIVLEILKSGWQVGYFPQLKLQHIIPAERMKDTYLAQLVNQTNKSWVQLLKTHGICPWADLSLTGATLRKIKAYFIYSAWLNKTNYIKWRGACGTFDGLVNQ